MPTRCSADTALGDAYRTRALPSSTITPSPTRGATLESATRPVKGNNPEEIIVAKSSKIERYVRSSCPGRRPVTIDTSRVSTAITLPSQTTGIADIFTGSERYGRVISPC